MSEPIKPLKRADTPAAFATGSTKASSDESPSQSMSSSSTTVTATAVKSKRRKKDEDSMDIDDGDDDDQNDDNDSDADVIEYVPGQALPEIKEDEELLNNNDDDDQKKRVFRPGIDELEDGEELQADPSAYELLQEITTEWPCLSLDVVKDSLGFMRSEKEYPHSCIVVAGSQAMKSRDNRLYVMRWSNLNQQKVFYGVHGEGDDEDGEDESSEEGSSDEDSDEEENVGEEEDVDKSDEEMGGNKTVSINATVVESKSLSKKDKASKSEKPNNDEDLDEETKKARKNLVISSVALKHPDTVLRVRMMPQGSSICATWSEDGSVYMWNIQQHIQYLESLKSDGISNPVGTVLRRNNVPIKPLFKYSGHEEEGFALNFSPHELGLFASGDNTGMIRIWKPKPGGWEIGIEDHVGLVGHRGSSVEDVQFKKCGTNCNSLFASCGSDGTVQIYDLRALKDFPLYKDSCTENKSKKSSKNKSSNSKISFKSNAQSEEEQWHGLQPILKLRHTPKGSGIDVNVLDWSPLQGDLIASGADDGSFKIWDIQLIHKYIEEKILKGLDLTKPNTKYPIDNIITLEPEESEVLMADFDYHREAITSISWHPTDETGICVSAVDGIVSLWDLAVENNEEDEEIKIREERKKMQEEGGLLEGIEDFPPQLLFLHQGCKEVRESLWHPQIPGVVICTGGENFNVFRAANF